MQTGWDKHLQGFPGYYDLGRALSIVKRPVTAEELAANVRRLIRKDDVVWLGGNPLAFPLEWPAHAEDPDNPYWRGLGRPGTQAEYLRSIIALAGMDDMRTVGDLLEVMVGLGLFVRLPHRTPPVLVPNAVPGMVWEVADIPEETRQSYRVTIGYADFSRVAEDIENLLTWAPKGQITATARQLGVRLATDPHDIIGALDLLAVLGKLADTPYPQDLDPEELLAHPLHIQQRTRPEWAPRDDVEPGP